MEQGKKSLIKVWGSSIGLILKHPSVVLPFFILFTLEALWLSMSYYAPRPPVSIFMGPLIKAFMGEQFLHYPFNFLTLPRLLIIGRVFGHLSFGVIALAMTALATQQLTQDHSGVRLFGNFNRSFRRYPSLVSVGLLFGSGCLIFHKVPRIIFARFIAGGVDDQFGIIFVFILSFLLIVLLEMFLVYAPIFIIIMRQKLWTAVRNSIMFCLEFFWQTLSFVLLFRALNLITIFMKNNLKVIMQVQFPQFPEVALFIMSADILLLFITHVAIAVMAAQRVLTHREIKS
ncbi:MAG: hypothetical protein ABII88_06270 [Candidatus Omnitrophota bacterium]